MLAGSMSWQHEQFEDYVNIFISCLHVSVNYYREKCVNKSLNIIATDLSVLIN